jgi:hypothetical protein
MKMRGKCFDFEPIRPVFAASSLGQGIFNCNPSRIIKVIAHCYHTYDSFIRTLSSGSWLDA